MGNVVCRRATQSSHFLGPSVKGLGIRVRRDPVRVQVAESKKKKRRGDCGGGAKRSWEK